jgi:hypothetical protein
VRVLGRSRGAWIPPFRDTVFAASGRFISCRLFCCLFVAFSRLRTSCRFAARTSAKPDVYEHLRRSAFSPLPLTNLRSCSRPVTHMLHSLQNTLAALAASLFASANLLAQQKPDLKITNPSAGTIFAPGQTVTVNVAATGGPFTSVGILSPPGTINGLAVLTAPPYQFSFTIPTQVELGPATISVIGTASVPAIATVSIDIERSDSPQSIATDHSTLELAVGHDMPVRVYGTYGDGAIVDLSQSTQTTYMSQNPNIATVIAGVVTAIAPGSTTIVVHRREHQAVVRVNVVRDAR